jgi:hypothetical protein
VQVGGKIPFMARTMAASVHLGCGVSIDDRFRETNHM